MKNLKKFVATLTLGVFLALSALSSPSAFAGDMPSGVIINPPPPYTGQTQQSSASTTATDSDEEDLFVVDPVTEMITGLLRTFLSMF